MKIKNKNGFVMTDVSVAVVAIIIFSTLIVSLMYNNFIKNVKIKKQTLAIIYLTQVLENIGISEYSEVTNDNLDLIPSEAANNGYDISLNVLDDVDLGGVNNENIIKKVQVSASYKVGNKQYVESMQRIKAKE